MYDKIEAKFTMVLGSKATCETCGAATPRGALVRMVPVRPDGGGHRLQCGPCAAAELLPLFDAEDKAMRARVAAEDQAHT